MLGLSDINFFVVLNACKKCLSIGDLCVNELWNLLIMEKDLFLTVRRTYVGSLFILHSTFFNKFMVAFSLSMMGKQNFSPNCNRACTSQGI